MTTEREHKARWKANHIKALESLGFKPSQFNRLRQLENLAHRNAEFYCNGDIEGEQWERMQETITSLVFKLAGKPINGFFVNGDPRGYALKIELETDNYKYSEFFTDDELRGFHKDWGGYVCVAPEF